MCEKCVRDCVWLVCDFCVREMCARLCVACVRLCVPATLYATFVFLRSNDDTIIDLP
jgi:hypothetical protein